ncbi:MAG: hypothetical protein R6W88_01525 [Desulfobacterales bacterium]
MSANKIDRFPADFMFELTKYEFKGIGRLLDDALEAVEKENPKLKGVLEKDYARKQIDPALPSLIDEIANIPFQHQGTICSVRHECPQRTTPH